MKHYEATLFYRIEDESDLFKVNVKAFSWKGLMRKMERVKSQYDKFAAVCGITEYVGSSVTPLKIK